MVTSNLVTKMPKGISGKRIQPPAKKKALSREDDPAANTATRRLQASADSTHKQAKTYSNLADRQKPLSKERRAGLDKATKTFNAAAGQYKELNSTSAAKKSPPKKKK